MMKELKVRKVLDIRFSEVDSMNVVWHGSYLLYFEDAREAFGEKYGLGYMDYYKNNCFAPLVELNIQYKKPILYGTHPTVEIIYLPTDAAKIVFDYKIKDENDEILATAHSVQVFTDTTHKLLLYSPEFYIEWKRNNCVD